MIIIKGGHRGVYFLERGAEHTLAALTFKLINLAAVKLSAKLASCIVGLVGCKPPPNWLACLVGAESLTNH